MEIRRDKTKRLMFLIVFTIFVWWIFDNIKFVGKGFSLFLGMITPLIIGLVIAFILNKPMSFFEEKLFQKGKVFGGLKDKYARVISFLITFIIFILVIAIVLILVIPNLIEAGEEIASKLPAYWENLQEFIKNSSTKYSKVDEWIQEIDFEGVNDSIFSFVKGGFSNWIGSTFTVFSSVIGGFVSAGLGLVFGIYFLFQKETLLTNLKRFIYAAFPLKVANKITEVGTITNESFSQFITGQTLDALALGAMFFVTMLIFRFPYVLMVSVLITITGFIPIVGAFIGLIIGGFLIFVENPRMAGFFVILFFILQQIESNVIYPRVVGKASGLSSVWILAAITIGGSLMGVVGILIFVPIFSVIQKLLGEYVDKKLEQRELEV